VALAEERVVACRAWHSGVNHTAELMPAVAQLLEGRGLRPRDLEAVAVALGPGGFSALRVGVSAAKGLCAASRIPIIGVATLDLEAFCFRDSGRDSRIQVCALLEAGRGEAASALFGPDGQRLRADRVSTAAELLAEIECPTIFCGEGLAPWADEIQKWLGFGAILCRNSPDGRVYSLAALARGRLERGEFDDLATLQPQYLRMPSIGAPKRRDRRPQESSRRPGRGRAQS
jgi:tRNA threonylcarbamoyladenosine biosynthesis protein TsaB